VSGRILDLDPRALGLKPANIDWTGLRTRARRLIGQVALGVLALAVVGTSFGGGEYFGFGFLPAVGLGVLYVIVRPNRLLPEESPPGEAEPLVEMFASRREFRRKKGRLMSEADPAMVKVLKGTLAEVHDAGVIAIVDRSLFNGIVSLPQSDGLLEEEPIVHGQPRRLSADIVIPALLGVMGISAVVSNLIQGIPDIGNFIFNMVWVLAMAFMAGTAWYSRWELQFKAPRLAGPGWIRSTRFGRKTWTVGDSVLYVRPYQNDALDIVVTVIGSTGSVKFRFDSIQDNGFLDLWQRWTCPEPRLELIKDVSSS
jgi:hypothetical protein